MIDYYMINKSIDEQLTGKTELLIYLSKIE
jgi:hypothetical protein